MMQFETETRNLGSTKDSALVIDSDEIESTKGTQSEPRETKST